MWSHIHKAGFLLLFLNFGLSPVNTGVRPQLLPTLVSDNDMLLIFSFFFQTKVDKVCFLCKTEHLV